MIFLTVSGVTGRFRVSRSFVVCAVSIDFQFLAKTPITETFTSRSAVFHSQEKKLIALKKQCLNVPPITPQYAF